MDIESDEALARRLQAEEDALHATRVAKTPAKRPAHNHVNASDIAAVDETAVVGFFVNTIPSFGTLAAAPNRFSLSLGQLFHGQVAPEHVVMFNYMVDPEWVVEAIPNFYEIGRITLVLDSRQRDLFGPTMKERNPMYLHSNFTVVFPRMISAYSCHHTKLMLMYYKTGLRVVITTSNLLENDWLSKNQGIWVQDFPRQAHVSTSGGVEVQPLGQFGRDLQRYLRATHKALGESKAAAELLGLTRFNNHDFRAACARLIFSTPGQHQPYDATSARNETTGIHRAVELCKIAMSHHDNPHDVIYHALTELSGKDIKRTRLSTAEKEEGIETRTTPTEAKEEKKAAARSLYSLPKITNGKPSATNTTHYSTTDDLEPTIIMQCSSLGSPGSFFEVFTDALGPDLARGAFRLVWPTVRDVRMSLEGYESGLSLPYSDKNCQKYLQHHKFSRWDGSHSGRTRAMPHIKSYTRLYREKNHAKDQDYNARMLWACLTSANATAAAWGRSSKLSSPAYVLHFEMGLWFDEPLWLELLAKVLTGEIPEELFIFSCTAPTNYDMVLDILEIKQDSEAPEVGSKRGHSGLNHSTGERAIISEDTKLAPHLIAKALERVRVSLVQPHQTTAVPRLYCGPVFTTSPHEIAQDNPFISFVYGIREWIRSNPGEKAVPIERTLHVILPFPYSLRPSYYSKEDQPWVVDKTYSERDCFGRPFNRSEGDEDEGHTQ